MLESDTAWHAGDWLMNCRAIGIEIVSAGEDFSEVEIAKAAWLTQTLQAKYDIPDDHVIRHFDVTGKRCPAAYVDGSKWAALRARLVGRGAVGGGDAGGVGGSAGAGGAVVSGDVGELARRVIAGEFGNGDARRAALGADYAAVQARVNEMLGSGGGLTGSSVDVDAMAHAVINGDYGNGDERRRRLGSHYDVVQARVNQMLS